MERIKIKPRENWQSKVGKLWGLLYHHNPDGVYWNESAYYLFNSEQIDVLDDFSPTRRRSSSNGAKSRPACN